MCIIIDNQKGERLSDEIITNCLKKNDDGFAIYHLDDSTLIKTMDNKKARKDYF